MSFVSSDDESLRLRADSGSDPSLLGMPIALRRERSQTECDQDEQQQQEQQEVSTVDFSFLELETMELEACLSLKLNPSLVTSLNLSGNHLKSLPLSIEFCCNLQVLDLSQNQLTRLDDFITNFTKLTTLIASNNALECNSFPKGFGDSMSTSLKVLSLGGNQFRTIPCEIFDLEQLRSLYLGGNRIEEISRDIRKLVNLRVLYLGGNRLTSVPDDVGTLQNLQSLSLCENRIQSLPPSIAMLTKLRSLALHKNQLTTLPQEIVRLRGLDELSLRNNPLVVRFVKDFTFNTPTLLELAGRTVKVNKLSFSRETVPVHLVEYLEAARRCVNPKCKGVYFDAHVEHIKFVDFCGIYRLPLLQYLCSPGCSGPEAAYRANSSDSEEASHEVSSNRLKRVLLG